MQRSPGAEEFDEHEAVWILWQPTRHPSRAHGLRHGRWGPSRMGCSTSSAGEAPAWRTSRRSTAGNEPAMCLPHLASARNRARGRRARAGATHEPPWRAARRARRRDRQKYPVCQQLARGIRRKVPGRNCHRPCRRAVRRTHHRRTYAVRQPRHAALAVRLAGPTMRPDARERTRPTMAHSRPLRPLRSHTCSELDEQTRENGEWREMI